MNNQEKNFKQVYKQSKDKIYRLCLGFMGNHAEADDLFQEIYIKVWNNLDQFKKNSNVNTWIYRIATNTALLQINRKNKANKRLNAFKSENLKVISEECDTRPYTDEKINELYQAISSLKSLDKIIISLVLENNSYSEIAEIMGMNRSNVGVRINRIKKILAKKMK